MAIIGMITVNDVLIVEVDTNPISSGCDVPKGSIACLHADGLAGATFVKYGDGANDWRQISYVDSHIINVSKDGGNFGSIKQAVDSITGSSSTNRYVVHVGPGNYTEDLIDMSAKPYICVVAECTDSVIVSPTTSSQHVFKIGADNTVAFLSINGVGSGYSGIAVVDSGGIARAHNISFSDCDIGVLVSSSTADTSFIGKRLDFAGAFTHSLRASSSNGFKAEATVDDYNPGPTSATPTTVSTYVSGPDACVDILSGDIIGFGVGVGLKIEDGACVNVASAHVESFGTALSVPNVGAAPEINLIGVSLIDNTTDINIAHPTTAGIFNGLASQSKCSNASPNFSWSFQDIDNGSFEVTEKISVTFNNGTHTDLSTLLFESSTMGLISGGALSDGGGLNVNLATGFGYLDDESGSHNIKRIDWTSQSFSLSANTVNFLYFTVGGILSAAASRPSTPENILLGRVVTNATGIEFIDRAPLKAHHIGNMLSVFGRDALGPVYQSGSIVTENVTALHLNVASGKYHFSELRFSPAGGSDISFTSYYMDGSSGWTRSASSTVSNSQYDDGSGTLAALSSSYYTKHTVYVVGDGSTEKYFLVFGQVQYSSLLDAEAADLPSPPSYFDEGMVPIASIYVQQGSANVIRIEDIRPVIGFKAQGITASATHGNLLGLSADDHPQYLLVTGSRAMAGNLDMGAHNIIDVGTVDGVTVSAHAGRHLPNGSDPIATGAPSSIGSANSAGTANALVRQDHVHQGVHAIKANAGSNRFGDLSLQNGTGITITDDGSGNFTIASSATVSSVALSLPSSVFSVSGSPVTSSGTLTGSFVTQAANIVFAGPTSGGAATPTFRTLVSADIPALSYVTSVALSLPSFITVTGSPVTSSGTLTGTLAVQTANTVFSGPTTGAAAAPTFRALVTADIPNLDASKITTGILPIARGGTNSGTALNSNRIMISSGGAIVESSAFTAGSVIFAATTTGLPTQSNANFFYDQTNNRLGLLTTTPTSTLSVGTTSQFQVDSNGNVVKINNVAYSWPSSQGTADSNLVNDGSGNLSWSSGSAGAINGGEHAIFDDFVYAALHDHSPFSLTANILNGGTGALETTDPVDNSYTGLVVLATGTTNNATGKATLDSSDAGNRIKAGGASQTIEWRVRLTNLSSASPRYNVKLGLQSSITVGDPANGVYFQYSDNLNSGQWRGVTRHASTSTLVNSTIAVAAATWYKLRMEIDTSGNVTFYVNDVSIGTSSTNLPTTNAMMPCASIEKGSTSTTSRDMDVDWLLYRSVR